MDKEKIKEIVYKYFSDGFHCAETITNSIYTIFVGRPGTITKTASGFCGGIGRCKQDICGALSGGIITLGSIYGREKGEEDISKVVMLSVELRELFIEEFGSTVCKEVVEGIAERSEYNNCEDVTAKATWLLYNLIKKDFD